MLACGHQLPRRQRGRQPRVQSSAVVEEPQSYRLHSHRRRLRRYRTRRRCCRRRAFVQMQMVPALNGAPFRLPRSYRSASYHGTQDAVLHAQVRPSPSASEAAARRQGPRQQKTQPQSQAVVLHQGLGNLVAARHHRRGYQSRLRRLPLSCR